jgi:hypothetical protein
MHPLNKKCWSIYIADSSWGSTFIPMVEGTEANDEKVLI